MLSQDAVKTLKLGTDKQWDDFYMGRRMGSKLGKVGVKSHNVSHDILHILSKFI